MTPEDLDFMDAMEQMLGKSSSFVFRTIGWLKGRSSVMSEECKIYIITRLESLLEQHEYDLTSIQLKNLVLLETATVVTCLGTTKHAEAWRSLHDLLVKQCYHSPPVT